MASTYLNLPVITVTAAAPVGGATDTNQTLQITQETAINTVLGAQADAVATTDIGTFSLIAFVKRSLQNWTTLQGKIPSLSGGKIPITTDGLTDTQLRATAISVLGPLTDTQLRATPVPVNGTVTANTGLTQPLTDTQLRATAVNVLGPLTDTQLRATAVPVNGTVTANIGTIAGISTETTQLAMSAKLPATIGAKVSASSLSVVLASDQVTLPVSSGAITGTISTAQKVVGTTAVRATVAGTVLGSTNKKRRMKPSTSNAGRIWYGSSTVTISTGIEIVGPDWIPFDFDYSDYYLISDTASQVVEILETT